MNRFRFLCLGLLGLVHGVAVANDQYPPAKETVVLHTYPNENNYGKFDGHGKLLVQEPTVGGSLLAWDCDVSPREVYFSAGSTKGIKLQNDIGNMNVFLAAEIRRPQTVRTFIKEHLGLFLTSNLGQDGDVEITPSQAAAGLGTEPTDGTRLSAAVRERLTARIRPYGLPGEPVVSGSHWTLERNILTGHGGVQHWTIRGQVSPLRIDSFLCETREPNGTFYPVVVLR